MIPKLNPELDSEPALLPNAHAPIPAGIWCRPDASVNRKWWKDVGGWSTTWCHLEVAQCMSVGVNSHTKAYRSFEIVWGKAWFMNFSLDFCFDLWNCLLILSLILSFYTNQERSASLTYWLLKYATTKQKLNLELFSKCLYNIYMVFIWCVCNFTSTHPQK